MEGSQANDESPILINEDGKEDNQKAETQVQEENALKRQDRRRTSKVWLEFTVITIDDGSKKVKCNYCSTLIAINSQGSTTQFHRHLDSCPIRLASTKKQRLLTTQPLSPSEFGGGSGGTITTYKYDKEKVRECLAKMVIAHEYSFRMFTKIVKQLQLSTSKGLILDVPTRWNSTYAMLVSALVFRDVFPRYKERDPSYIWLPSSEDWIGPLSLLMAMGAILDPRYKMKLIEFCYSKIYPAFKAHEEIQSILFSLHKLYAEYVNCSTSNVKLSDQSRANFSTENTSSGRVKNKTKGRAEFDLWAQELDTIIPIKSDLDIYLEEGLYVCKEDSDLDFNALDWWKANTLKFRTLSSMARDILSIPITSVASESAFSAGGRVLDQYRSSLNAETVQALVCTGDWLLSEWNIAKSAEVKIRDHKGCVDDSNKVSS
ncbi:hypothetical protein BUALT_Bualt04G0113000 [Buddleja alternifolia]|uniref:BED-type domain-containing protein n=1 Tax=Buddleja alternifolia TaxID=168488 RepID=A0AAV6XN42_9LAMI|nr:hypothetical protein BUALT_Bualt04G0113000 [Buddleja alternifolia]